MKILITERQLNLINELRGISSDSRSWIQILIDIAKKSNIKNEKITVNGKDYPEAYERFPVDRFEIQLNDQFSAYDEQTSGYENDEYVVYFYLSHTPEKYEVSHELKHAFEDFKRKSKGKRGLSGTKETNLFFSGDFVKIMMDRTNTYFPYNEILKDLYYTSKIEQSAYSDTVFDGDDRILHLIKKAINGGLERDIKKFSSEKSLQNTWDKLKTEINIPIFNKFNDYQSFLDWAFEYIRYRGGKALKRLHKVKYFRNNLK